MCLGKTAAGSISIRGRILDVTAHKPPGHLVPPTEARSGAGVGWVKRAPLACLVTNFFSLDRNATCMCI
jgi:hypothetical protein